MADATQTVLTMGIPTVAVLIGILVNNSRLGDVNNRIADVRQDMNRRFDESNRRNDDTRDLLRAEFICVEQVLGARAKHLEDNR
jgi:hypothetical protein